MRHPFILSLLLSTSIACSAAPASVEAIDTLLTVTKAEALIGALHVQVEQMMGQTLAQVLGGRKMTEEQKRIIEAAPRQFSLVMKEELSWANMRPMYVSIYQETFTQEEIEGLIAFYRSPAGAAFIDKMPVVMQKSAVIMQARMPQLMEKMKATMQKTLVEAGVSR